MNFLLHLRQEWDVIVKSPFACVVCLVIGFAVGSWYYAEQVATLNSQVAFWKDKATATTTVIQTVNPGAAPAARTSSASAPGVPVHLTMDAEGVSFFTSPSDNSQTGVILDVLIKNSGTPSIATAWKLKVTPKRGNPVVAQSSTISKQELQVAGNPPVILRASEGLAEKVRTKPLQSGKAASGRLLFYVSLPQAVVEDDATVLQLSVQDISGSEFNIERRVGDLAHSHSDSQ